jgi:hypothetical protein
MATSSLSLKFADLREALAVREAIQVRVQQLNTEIQSIQLDSHRAEERFDEAEDLANTRDQLQKVLRDF